jgi:hypothetical protein
MRAPKTDITIEALPTEAAPGDYLCSERDLYYVEHVGPQRALLEDCRTGTLLDVSNAEVQRLRLVTHTADGCSP